MAWLLHVATRTMGMQQSQRNGLGDRLAAGADDHFFMVWRRWF